MTEIKNVAVVGAGTMGHGIGQEFARAGCEVVLHARREQTLREAITRIQRNLNELREYGLVSNREIESILSRIHSTTVLKEAIIRADLVVEAIPEELEAKQQLFRILGDVCPERTILASNTSSLLPSMLSSGVRHPERVLVIHFFYPAHLMPLVEIVPSPLTSSDVVDCVLHFLRGLGKSPILVRKEVPGFIANRLQVALQREALHLVEAGIATPQEVDMAVKEGFGRRLGVAGPIELLELMDGWTQALQIHRFVLPDLDSSREPSFLMLKNVEQNRLGAKTGRGFYEWTSEATEKLQQKLVNVLVSFLKAAHSQT